MKNILKKFQIMSKKSENEQGFSSLEGNKSNHGSVSSSKKLNRKSHSSTSLNQGKFERMEPSDTGRSVDLSVVSDSGRHDLGCREKVSRDPEVEEEYQLKLALEMSAKEDPEAVQIEAVKQISLGSCDPDNSPAEIVAYRYWIYPFFTELQCSWLRRQSHGWIL
ncbi:hypothetical protein RYX36_007911 [Vicia faba]